MTDYLFQIISNEDKIHTAEAHLSYTEEDVDPQSARGRTVIGEAQV
jgi:hypothetical protein